MGIALGGNLIGGAAFGGNKILGGAINGKVVYSNSYGNDYPYPVFDELSEQLEEIMASSEWSEEK